nr:reverse transcriptase domain-containing protein [Tanacetum cinerariifolium]
MYFVEHCAHKGAPIRSPTRIGAGLREHFASMKPPNKIPNGDQGGFEAWFAKRVWGWRVAAPPHCHSYDGIQSSCYLKMSGNKDHHRQGRRFVAGGNGHDGCDPRDVEIERLRQRVRKLEINPFDRYERQYEDTPTDTAVEEYENEGGEFKKNSPTSFAPADL